jgi:hypothetical protein
VSGTEEIVVLYRPAGKEELDLIHLSGDKEFPPRLPEQPIFYPVIHEEYAIQIARDWNAKYNDPRCGYVTRFRVRKSFLDRYQPRTVGGSAHQEYWIPAEELDEFNGNLIGQTEVIAEFNN